jgi:hypothetical protein
MHETRVVEMAATLRSLGSSSSAKPPTTHRLQLRVLTMAAAGPCSTCYYSPPTLSLHRPHGLLPRLPPQAARRGRWPRLQVSAAAGGARAGDSIKAATDAEFFEPGDTRPIMLFDGTHWNPSSPSQC